MERWLVEDGGCGGSKAYVGVGSRGVIGWCCIGRGVGGGSLRCGARALGWGFCHGEGVVRALWIQLY